MNILSLGLGVQSTAMYYMSCMGELPRADYAVFADTGKEKSGTLQYLEYLQNWAADNNGIPIIVIQKKNLFKDIIENWNSTGQRFVSIPAFTKNPDGTGGMLRRQCSNEYKIEQIDREIRALHGLRPRQRTPVTTVWKGITVDEIERVSIPQERWKIAYYPFCGYQVTLDGGAVRLDTPVKSRLDIIQWYTANALPVPPKSACVFCPYMNDAAWKDMKENHPADFEAAILVDEKIRMPQEQRIQNPVFLHRSLVPLKDINFPDSSNDLWTGNCSSDCDI